MNPNTKIDHLGSKPAYAEACLYCNSSKPCKCRVYAPVESNTPSLDAAVEKIAMTISKVVAGTSDSILFNSLAILIRSRIQPLFDALVKEISALRAKLATERAEKAVLRNGLRLAHDQMFTWFSSEYAEHPTTRKIREILDTTGQDALDGIRGAIKAMEERDRIDYMPTVDRKACEVENLRKIWTDALTKLKEIFP